MRSEAAARQGLRKSFKIMLGAYPTNGDEDLMRTEDIRSIILGARPEKLVFPVPSLDHADHVVRTALAGHVKLAADHLLNKEMVGALKETVGNVIRQLNLEFNRGRYAKPRERGVLIRARSYEVLIQIALNLFGVESRRIGFSEEEVSGTLDSIAQTLDRWERLERKEYGGAPIAKTVIGELISDMKKVMSKYYRAPGSMVAKMAESIERGLKDDGLMSSFLAAARKEIQGNIYYRMTIEGMCKFGNDYAIGLRPLRHLGFVQVSTNPVLAAIAYDDDPSLWEGFKGESLCKDFRTVVKEHPEWLEGPEKYGDEITMQATELSIFPNLAVFRPIAVASNLYHGMISYQINPNVADSREGSLKDALQIYSDAQEFLKRYDEYLLWGYSPKIGRGRPNLVLKVAANTPAAIDITADLESLGIGTNNTVTFSVPQETTLILAKMKGRAMAVRQGIHPSTVYETTMGGRLDDHLREVQAESLLRRALERVKDKKEALRDLAEKLGAWEEARRAPSVDEMIRTVCSRRYLRPMTKEPFIDLLTRTRVIGDSRERTEALLSRLEKDIGYAGIIVTHRVYWIFFSPENKPRWLAYLRSKYGLTEEQAREVMRGIDMLPASKRKPEETLLTLGREHMTNTEFPNHQLSVLMRSRETGFNPEDYENAVLKEIDPGIVHRLLEEWEDIRDDCRSALELTPELIEVLRDVGIEPDFGDRGHQPSDWPGFGPVVKTMSQFANAYNRFKERVVGFVREMAEEASS